MTGGVTIASLGIESLMVERYHRGKGKKKLLSSHQKSWVWGRNLILETLRAARWPIVGLHLSESLPSDQLESTRRRAEELQIPVMIESSERLQQRCHSREHQGYLAKMGPYCYVDGETVLRDRLDCSLFAILDSIQDPYNFGAIIRSANVMGIDALFVGREGQVKVTSLVARASAGAVNHVKLAQVDDLTVLVEKLKEIDVEVVCSTHDAEHTLFEQDMKRPTAIVIGNEGDGIRDELSDACDTRVRIIQSGEVECLNAAVAAGILFYEAARQRYCGGESCSK
jgi:23S rRNA (guanosine2251-2'-O)-methyltransferase